LNHGLQFPGEDDRDRLPARLFAEGDGLLERLQAGKAGKAFSDVRVDLPQLGFIHLPVDVFGKFAEQFQAVPMIMGLTGHV
jgi:hypothetical protein